MQQYKILTRTLLMLSIINFTLPAPVAVQERPEVRLAASQKRAGLLDESGSMKVPGPDHALPPSPDSTDNAILRLIDFGPPYSPESSTGYVPTGSQLPAGSMPVASSPPESGLPNMPGPDHALPATPDSTDNAILRLIDFGPPYSPESSTGYVPTWSQLPAGSMPVASSPPESGSRSGSSADGPGPGHSLSPSPDSTDSAIWRQIDLSPPYSSESLTGYVQPSPGSSTGSRLSVGSMPVAGSLSPSPPESGSMHVPGPDHAPVPSLDSTSWSELMQYVELGKEGQHRQIDSPLPPWDRDPLDWGASNVPGLDHGPPPSPGFTDILSQISHAHSPINPPPPWEPLDWGSLNVPGLDHVPPPSPDFTNILSQIPHADRPPTPDSLGSSTESHYVPPSPGPPTGSVGPMPVVGSLSPLPPPLPHPNEPGPSDDRYPPGFEPKPDTLPSTGSTSNQPIPPQPESPGVDPEKHLLNSETFPIEFWDKFMKGKIKRRISGSHSVGLAQKDPRLLDFPRRRDDAAIPLHGPLGQLRN